MKGEIRDVREIIREEMLMRAKIMAALQEGPMTVPEIALAVGRPAHEVMYWVMGMRKYGQVAETEEDDGYFKYRAVLGEGK
ncbi:transcriptional regulator [Desulfotruncus alcoholivorax]|uniref:transcriptional regulator n=1 Tax=Desulfotruncus alcoholivorax TaxID=265477 RepID=UPI0003FBD7EC|nr:transcriptional regulator [Desulfotruncus alcoholivorax]